MPTEYHLQKRGLSIWHYVTWYTNEAECRLNFLKASAEGNGNSWRMVSVEVIEEKLNEGERECLAPERGDDDYVPNENTVSIPVDEWRKLNMGVPDAPKSDWGTPTPGWGKPITSEAPFKSEHGLVGSVWVGNPTTKEKKRVAADIAATMLNEGWLKVGPRTVL